MKNSDSKLEILIDLRKSSNTTYFEGNNVIHSQEIKRIEKIINERKENINSELEYYKDHCKFRQRYHDTISVLGSRGSGKTSFLLTLLEKYQKDSIILPITILDPTLIEEKGHIFLTIISQIKEAVEKAFKSERYNPECPKMSKQKIWREKLKNLAHGLPSIDGIGRKYEDNWHDPEYVMDKGLRAVSSAKKLEQHFHTFVNMSLEILGKKILLLTLDDIDVNFEKGWPVLETIRKYLTTPQVITIISGDIDLFSKAIRKRQWKNFGKELLINEADRLQKMSEYNDLVTEMEGQYLQKVLKPEKRIHLNTLLEKIESYKAAISIDDNGEVLPIKDYYKRIFKEFGITNISQVNAYNAFLLSLPLRTQIQFMLQFNIFKAEFYSINVTDPFLSDLYEKQVQVEQARNMPSMLNIVILKLLLKEKSLSESYQLQPITSDTSLNSSLVSLSLLFSQKVNNHPHLIFDYIIRIAYIRNLLGTIEYKDDNSDNMIARIIPSIEGLCKYAQLYQDKELRNTTGTITAYLRGFLNYQTNKKENVHSYIGTIPVKGLYGSGKKDKEGRIDWVFRNETNKKYIAQIPLNICASSVKNSTIVVYSVFGLLATISDLIREKENLSEALLVLSQIRTHMMPDFTQKGNDDDFDDIDELDLDATEVTGNTQIIEKQIRIWIECKTKPQDMKISPYLLGKIATRFYYTLVNIDKIKQNNLGDYMRYCIIALLNAILVEDAIENYNKEKQKLSESMVNIDNLNLNNTRTSYSVLRHNIAIVSQLEGNFSFSKWMLSCPLFLYFLPKDFFQYLADTSCKLEDITRIFNPLSQKALNESIYTLLCEVEIRKPEERADKSDSIGSIPFYGRNDSDSSKTIRKLMALNADYRQFIAMTTPSEFSIFIKKYQLDFSNTITEAAIKSLQSNIQTAIKARNGQAFTLAAKEWSGTK